MDIGFKAPTASRDAIEKDKTRLFYALCCAIALLVLLLGLSVGLFISNPSNASWVTLREWVTSLTVNIGAGIVTVILFAWLIRAFHVDHTETSAFTQKIDAAGLRSVLSDWLREKPTNEQLHEMFTRARIVHLLGVTLHNSLIGLEWFPKALAERISDPGKETRLMLMDPNSAEVKRREAEGTGRKLYMRACSTKEQIECAIDNASGSPAHNDKGKVARFFDFSQAVNILRFDDRMFVVLLMYGKGGLSPALEIERPGFLFEKYGEAFDAMWHDLEGNK